MDSTERLSCGVSLVPSGEVSGSMLAGLVRAFRHIQVISDDLAVHLAKSIESTHWYPMADGFRLLNELCRHEIDYGPILFQAGVAVVEDWYTKGAGRGQAPSPIDFLRMQANSGGYRAVHRGKPEEIGWMDLLELDEKAGRALIVCVTPYPAEFERGILYGGTRVAGAVEYVRVESIEEPYNRHLSKKTITVRFAPIRRETADRLDAFLKNLQPGMPVEPVPSLFEAMAWRLKGVEEQRHIERRFHRQSVLLLDEATKELEDANHAKERLFAAASHDLRQPIQAMGLFLDALGATASDEERARHAGSIRIALNALRELLDALLDIAKLDSGTVVANPLPVQAEDLFAEIDSTFSPLALSKGLRLTMHFPARPPTMLIDRRLLLCVLNNFISNALKNTKKGGVLIALRPRGASWVFQVWDTGPGIATEHLERIFDEYYQVDNPGRDRAEGLGLGLAIARRICKLLGLRLHCRSRVGRGSMFEVRLPFAAFQTSAAAPAAQESCLPLDPSVFHGKHFVMVEDDPLVSAALREALVAHGIDVRSFRNAEAALADQGLHEVDGFIVDHQLAGRMNGLDFLHAVSERRGSSVKAVVISGNTTAEFVCAMRDLDWPLLFKPVDTQEILGALAR